MSLRLRNGDYIPDGAGDFKKAEGTEALLEEAMFRLTARRGGFAPWPELGSRLYLLHREKPEARNGAARSYAQEALTDMGIQVTGAETKDSGEGILVTLELRVQGNERTMEVTIR